MKYTRHSNELQPVSPRVGECRASGYRLIALLFATLVGFPTSARSATDEFRIARQPACPNGTCGLASTPHPSVCRVSAAAGNSVSYGSGSLVAVREQYALVVTNWHVVRDATGEISVVFPDGFHSPARVMKVDREWDLAALAIWRPNASPVRLSASAPKPGDVLTIAGYGSGSYRAAAGRCTQYVAPSTHLPFEMVEVSVQARQGDSGGPIFNDRGELAGVLFGAGRGTTSGSYAGRVRSFLAAIEPQLATPNFDAIAQQPSEHSAATTAPTPPPQRPLPLASTPSEKINLPASVPAPSASSATTFNPTPHGPLPKTPTAAAPTTPVASTNMWNDFAGTTPFDNAKTILAFIGTVALLFQVSRLLN